MLKEITAKNFKLFGEQGVSISLGKVTVLIGANGTGKSSVLQLLQLLRQSLQSTRFNLSGSFINIGTYKDIAHRQQVEQPIEVGISATYDGFYIQDAMEPFLPASGILTSHTVVKEAVTEQTGTIGEEGKPRIVTKWRPGSSTPYQPSLMIAGTATFYLGGTSQIGLPIGIGNIEYLRHHGAPEIQAGTDTLDSLLGTISRHLSHFYLVPAIRGFDSLTYAIAPQAPPIDLTATGNQATLVANLIGYYPELAEQVAARLNAILHRTGQLRQRLVEGRIASEIASGPRSTNLLNEAFGLNQLVPLMFLLRGVSSGSTIGIEEPEIHLHPRAQAALCDHFVDIATQDQKQLLLTTHSEHVLMSLLTAVAEGRLQPNDLAVYEFRCEDEVARATRLEVNEAGQIQGGLKGFLEVDIDEIGDLIKARFR